MGLFSKLKPTRIWVVILDEESTDKEYNGVSKVMNEFDAKQIYKRFWLVEAEDRKQVFDAVSECCDDANALVIGITGEWSYTNRGDIHNTAIEWLSANHQRLF